MKFGPRLTREFFERPCPEVARDLLGAILIRTLPSGERLAARLIEVEAYQGEGLDPASHAHAGRTQRNGSMFDAPGRIYAYRIYGVHTCVNVVCEAPGSGAAVLLRAAEPISGISQMRQHRSLAAVSRPDSAAALRQLTSGPGRLAQAFGLALSDDGQSVLRGPIAMRAPNAGSGSSAWPLPGCDVEAGPRVGITRGTDLAYRFSWKGHPLVSPFRPGKRRKR